MKKTFFLILTLLLSNICFGQYDVLIIASKQQAGGSSYDPDAQAFINAVGTLTTAEEVAINNLVLGLKANGTWSKKYAIYPFIGDTSSEHKWNLKNPNDTNAAFRLVFNGGVTHNDQGFTPNGTSGFANTFWNPANNGVLGDASLNFYSSTNPGVISGQNPYDMGVYAGSGGIYLSAKNLDLDIAGGVGTAFTRQLTTSNSIGYFSVSRISNGTNVSLYKNGTVVNTETAGTASLPNYNMYIGADNFEGAVFGEYANRTYGYADIGAGLTTTEISNDYAVVLAYVTALSRD